MKGWPGIDPYAAMMCWLTGLERDKQRKQEVDKQMIDEALDRCGFHVKDHANFNGDREVEILNARNEPLTPVEKAELVEVVKIVRAEHQERQAQIKLRRQQEEEREKAEAKARYDEEARPYREARLAKKRAYLAKQRGSHES